MVQWHGLSLIRINQIAQFIPKAVFRQFGDEVSETRGDGDKDPAKSILADTMELIGNSAYVQAVTNKEKTH